MKISIIVPTRNRSKYLRHCLATCLAPDDKSLEVIVSDNNSTDDTRDAVAKITDSRLRYFNTDANLSMRQNFEFALSKATGDYIVMIGDDDGVLKNGYSTLRYLIEKHQPDAINWRILRYIWPHTQPEPTEGVLNFRSRDFFGPVRHLAPQEILARFCSAETVKYKDGGNLYHGCVARPVIEALKKKTGEYFQAANPDMYASLANVTEAKSLLWIKNPITIGGESEKSTGAGSSTKQAATRDQAEVIAGWGALAQADTVKPEFDPSVRPIIPFTYAILNRVNRLLCRNSLTINHLGWRYAVRKDMEDLPADERDRNEESVQALFADADPQYRRPKTLGPAPARPVNGTTDKVKLKKKRRIKISPRHTKTVASVAEWIDTLTGSPHFPRAGFAVATASQMWKMIAMDIKAKKLGGSQ